MTKNSSAPLWMLAVLCAAVFWIYRPALNGGFVYDDRWYVVQNSFVHHPLALRSLFVDPRVTAAPQSGLSADVYRPLTTLWFWIDAHLWGANPFPYHVQNLILHLACGLLLFALLRRWLSDAWAAVAGAAVFLLHPVQEQSAAWITQRSSVASTAFFLAALIGFTAEKPSVAWRWILGCVAAAIALLFRETAVVLPLFFAAVVFTRREAAMSAEQNQRRWAGLLLLLGLSAFYLLVRHGVLGHWSQRPGQPQSWLQNFLLGILAFPVYLGKILLPLKLRMSYRYPTANALTLTASISAWIAYAALTLWAVRRDRWTAVGLLWIFFGLLPVLQIIPIRAFVAERFLYLPLAGMALIVGRIATLPAGRALCIPWLFFLMFLAWRTVPAWRNDQTLWAESVRQDPTNAFARLCYASALDDPKAAAQQYALALQSHPNAELHFAAVNNLANTLLRLGRNEEAFQWAAQAKKEQPESAEAAYTFGQAAIRTGRCDDARAGLTHLEKLLGISSPPARNLRQAISEVIKSGKCRSPQPTN